MTDQEVADEAADERAVEVPLAGLEPETLRSIVDDLITRDGTDYGAVERTSEQKAAALMRQLQSGAAKLVFDPVTETISVMTALEFKQQKIGE